MLYISNVSPLEFARSVILSPADITSNNPGLSVPPLTIKLVILFSASFSKVSISVSVVPNILDNIPLDTSTGIPQFLKLF